MSKYLKKILSLTLCLFLLFVFSVLVNASTVNIIENTAIPISTKQELNNIRNDLTASYYLTSDIEFTAADFQSGGAFYNDGKGFSPIGNGKQPFAGNFDGNGFVISGLQISVYGNVYTIKTTPIATESTAVVLASDGWTDDYYFDTQLTPTVSPAVGLFGESTGTITDVTLANSNISASSTNSAAMYVGGIVGHNKGTVARCSVKNTVVGYYKAYLGGIVGYQSGGSIMDCYVRGNLSSGKVLGGVAGAVAGGSVSNSYSYVNDFATFGVVGADIVDNVIDCYYVSDEELVGFGERIAISDAKSKTAFIGFDFDNIWHISDRLSIPVLNGANLPEGVDALLGDTNRDKKIDLADLVNLAQYVAGWDVNDVAPVANVNRDFNQDNVDIIDLNDVIYLAQYVAGWDGVDLIW